MIRQELAHAILDGLRAANIPAVKSIGQETDGDTLINLKDGNDYTIKIQHTYAPPPYYRGKGDIGTITRLTTGELDKLIEAHEPIGLFYCDDDDAIIGVDNSTGDCWMMVCETMQECSNWLRGK